MIFILELILAVTGMFLLLLTMVLLNLIAVIGYSYLIDPKEDGDELYSLLGKLSRQVQVITLFLFIPIGLIILIKQRRLEKWKTYLERL
jgi:hypothetical protein